MVPNHARYQLRYTREFDALPKASAGCKIKMLDYFTTEKCFCQLKMKICEKLNFRLAKCDDMWYYIRAVLIWTAKSVYPGVAQLVARLTGGQEAVSSSLATRTIVKDLKCKCIWDPFIFSLVYALPPNSCGSISFCVTAVSCFFWKWKKRHGQFSVRVSFFMRNCLQRFRAE